MFIELRFQNMLCKYINCFECYNKNKNTIMYTTCSELGIFMHWTCNMTTILQVQCMKIVCIVTWCKSKCFWQRFTCTSYMCHVCIPIIYLQGRIGFLWHEVTFWNGIHFYFRKLVLMLKQPLHHLQNHFVPAETKPIYFNI